MEPDDLSAAWHRARARLPEGWELDGLRCASTGLGEGERSDVWIAVAVGPAGQEVHARAPGPAAALERLADRLAGDDA